MSCELTLEVYGVRVRVVDAAGAGICARLEEALPPSVPGPELSATQICYVLQRAEAGEAAPGYKVVSDDRVLFQPATADEAVAWLRGAIDGAVAVNSGGGLFVHAGVVGWRGRAIVIPGRSMTGKSTLVAALVRKGATYYSDEFAVLDEEGRVHPYARTPIFRATSGAASGGQGGAPAGDRPLPVSLIVSTPYRDGSTWLPTVVSGARAVLPLIDNTLLARAQPERTLRLAAKMASTVVTLEGSRPDAEVAAARILEFLDATLDGTATSVAARSPQAVWSRAQAALAVAPPPPPCAEPARHAVIDGVLDAEEHARLLQYALTREAGFAASGVMAPDGTTHVDPGFRKSGTIYDSNEILKVLEGRLRRFLPHVRRELGLSWFPLGRVEVQMAVHQDGGFFGAHTDDGRPDVAGRRVTCVYYFHRVPRRFDGGELLVYDTTMRDGHPERGGVRATVEPADNTAVFFASGLFHEVRAVRRHTDVFGDSRFSINVWFWLGRSPLTDPVEASPRSDG